MLPKLIRCMGRNKHMSHDSPTARDDQNHTSTRFVRCMGRTKIRCPRNSSVVWGNQKSHVAHTHPLSGTTRITCPRLIHCRGRPKSHVPATHPVYGATKIRCCQNSSVVCGDQNHMSPRLIRCIGQPKSHVAQTHPLYRTIKDTCPPTGRYTP